MTSSKQEYLVGDLIIDDEFDIIEPDVSVVDAAKKMKEKNIPDLVVIDSSSQKVLGVVADWDIVQNVVAEKKDLESTTVKSVMYMIKPVSLKTTVKEAFERMRDLNVNVVPVVDGGKFKGVATIQDCWSYIPDENVDEVGLIPVKNPKFAEFWVSSISAMLAFVLGVLLPLAGVYGYFIGDPNSIASLFNIVEIRGGEVTFYLFRAIGSEFSATFSTLIDKGGFIWGLIVVNSFILLIMSVVGLFSLFYSAYSDIKSVRTGNLVRTILPALVIVFMALQWIYFGIAFGTAGTGINVSVDATGLVFSIISMLMILLSLLRDYIFKQESNQTEVGNEVTA